MEITLKNIFDFITLCHIIVGSTVFYLEYQEQKTKADKPVKTAPKE